MLNIIIGVNGVYDIICSISILLLGNCRISRLHITMFTDNVHNIGNELWHRHLAYWILTYGCVRLMLIINNDNKLCAMTYLLEGISYILETLKYKTIKRNGIFVGISSLCLFTLLLLK